MSVSHDSISIIEKLKKKFFYIPRLFFDGEIVSVAKNLEIQSLSPLLNPIRKSLSDMKKNAGSFHNTHGKTHVRQSWEEKGCTQNNAN